MRKSDNSSCCIFSVRNLEKQLESNTTNREEVNRPMNKAILILAANPKDTSRLRIDQEVREIENGLQRGRKRDDFSLRLVLAARPLDVRRAMLDLEPNIVHFCGHGSGKDGIVLEDENGQAKLVRGKALAGLFELFADKVECVVLNACYSDLQAKAIAKHISNVIGMKKAIVDDAAILFTVAFYDAIVAGKSYEFAFKFASNAIQWADLPKDLKPILILRARAAPATEQPLLAAQDALANPKMHPGSNIEIFDIFETFDRIYNMNAEWKKTENELIKYRENSEMSKDIPTFCKFNIKLARLYQHRGDYDKVIECCNAVLKYKDQCKPETLIDTLILFGDTFRMQGEYKEALSHFAYADTFLKRFPQDSYNLFEARITLSRGFIFDNTGNDDVEKELAKSFEHFEKICDVEGKAAAYVYLGIHKLGKKDFAAAEEMFQQALSISHDKKNRSLENFVLNQQTILRFSQGKTEEAYKLCIDAIRIQLDMGTKYGIAVSLKTLSSIIQSANDAFDMSELVSLLVSVNSLCGELLTQSQQKKIQMLYRQRSNINLPIFLCNCSITLFTKLGAKYALCEALIEKASICIELKKIKIASKILEDIQRKYSSRYGYRKIDIEVDRLKESINLAILETEKENCVCQENVTSL